ncbi:related to integral membrane protein [Rhynchosporium graminicola]|uniref:Related to integral membrane protein n=1 Tax=Rhynchosporium graminicola TaxID=2792576 RepID=A0A1E1L2T8_9HELO|nr:related to integral membrane protein [Rhynchosporium commune]
MAENNTFPAQNTNNLLVPDPSPYFQDAVTGRERSNSMRSQQSQRSGSDFGSSTPLGLETPNEMGGRNRTSIRIRRGISSVQVPTSSDQYGAEGSGSSSGVRRNRSVSDPQRGQALGTGGSSRLGRGESYMPEVREENVSPTTGRATEQFPPISEQVDREDHYQQQESEPEKEQEVMRPGTAPESTSRWRNLRRAKTNVGSDAEKGKGKETQSAGGWQNQNENEYEEDLVDLLDLVDPEISTLQTLTNVQNSLFVPDLGKYLNRRPTYNLTKRPTQVPDSSTSGSDDETIPDVHPKDETRPSAQRVLTGATLNTITSRVNEKYYAVLPHGVRIPNWSEEEKLELNDHVRHMLHSRRSKFKRSMKGFKQYVSKPLGFFVTFYAVSITAFGLAWVLFLIGWINVGGSRNSYLVNIIDNVLVALFAVMGDGLAPFRCIDTYHMIYIAHYHHLTWRLRREKSLPKLANDSDLPAVQPSEVPSPEASGDASTDVDVEKQQQEYSVLSPEQVKKLQHHQKKFARSHSFYKPHETATHYAFPLRLLVAIVVLLDCHSLLQIALGTCTWAISYHVRPFALTTVILCCSITVNITAGILITVGDHKTRKKDVREKMVRQEMTKDAIKKVEKKRRHELKKAGIIADGEAKESALDNEVKGGTEEERSARQSRKALRIVDPSADAAVPEKF